MRLNQCVLVFKERAVRMFRVRVGHHVDRAFDPALMIEPLLQGFLCTAQLNLRVHATAAQTHVEKTFEFSGRRFAQPGNSRLAQKIEQASTLRYRFFQQRLIRNEDRGVADQCIEQRAQIFFPQREQKMR